MEAWESLLQVMGCRVEFSEGGPLLDDRVGVGLEMGLVRRSVELPGWSELTRREAEVADYLCEGKSCAEIAVILSISTRTVEKHAERIFRKLGISSRRKLKQKGLE